jgi:hypothetical protein
VSTYQGIVLGGTREWVCPHRHRTERTAFDCALRELIRQAGRLLFVKGDPRDPRPPGRSPFFGQWSAFTREAAGNE